jgi:uncharacterized membrane protein YhaH (DUF805 family)
MNPSLLWTPKGRIARGEFWLGFLIVMVASAVAGAIPVVGPLLGLGVLWPQLVIHIKRLHDIGWTGWLLLFPFSVTATCMTLIVLNGGAALLTTPPQHLPALIASPAMHTPLIFFEIAFAVEFAFLLWVGITKGEAAANRFGPAPA